MDEHYSWDENGVEFTKSSGKEERFASDDKSYSKNIRGKILFPPLTAEGKRRFEKINWGK